MKTTLTLTELTKLINLEHKDPHSLLGMHTVTIKGKEMQVVRAFVPQAKKITIQDDENKSIIYPMTKIHEDGFFEVLIKSRKHFFKYNLCITNYNDDSWSTADPYSFLPTVTEYDRHLFNAGNHYNIYEKLGAHAKNVNGVDGVSFAVWAPNAKFVSIVGSFNCWDNRQNPMRCLGESGIWEIFIPNLADYDAYKFCIKTQNNECILKADPYANFTELRPNTASLVYDINGYNWKDEQWLKDRATGSFKNKPINIYEVHLGSYKRNVEMDNAFLTYEQFADDLVSYVKEMGYTHIELMPIEEHPLDASWGYQVTAYYSVTSRFGNPKEFMYFIDMCHQNGIGVILDWVPAHFPKDGHALARFDGTALYEHQDPKQGEHPDWGTYIFNYGRNEVRNFLIANALFWIKEYHIDGIRVDAVASMLYLDYGKNENEWVPNIYGGKENLESIEFIKHMNSVIAGQYPDVLMIAEESTSWAGVTEPVLYDGLGFNLKWNMGWMNDYLRYIEKEPIHKKYHHNDLTFSFAYTFSENFVLVLSHDEVVHGKKAMIAKMPGDIWQKFANLRLSYGFMMAHPGKKLNFMGNEFGQFDEWTETKSLDWFLLRYDTHNKLQYFVKKLNHIYLENPTFWQEDFDNKGLEWLDHADYQRSIISFLRKKDDSYDECIIFICNYTPETYQTFRVGVPVAGVYKEILNSDSEEFGGSGVINYDEISSEVMHWNYRDNSIEFKLPPLGFVAFKLIKKY